MYKVICKEILDQKEMPTLPKLPPSFNAYLLYIPSNQSFDVSEEKVEQTNCVECSRPFSRRCNEKWRTMCPSCYLLINGIIVDCSGCDKRIPIYTDKKNEKNYCRDCYRKVNGCPKVCLECFATFYYIDDKDEIPNNCYDCFMKKNGVRQKCVDCRVSFNVKKETKQWKKRCYDCWIENGINRKKSKSKFN